MANALLLFVAVLALTSTVCSSSLREFFLKVLNNSPNIDHQLQLILTVSGELVKAHITTHDSTAAKELEKTLQPLCSADAPDRLIKAARAALAPLRRFAAEDGIAAVLARRMVLACITLHREALLNDVSQGETEQFFGDVTRELYGTHVDTVLRKSIVDYLHISKSGGTSFSLAARLSNCKMAFGIGQPLYIGDLPHWINRTAFNELTGGIHMTWSIWGRVERGEVSGCRGRIANVTAKGFQYLSNEYTLHGGMEGMAGVHVCREAVNVVTLRSPEARLLSHLHFLLPHIKGRITRHKVRAKEGGGRRGRGRGKRAGQRAAAAPEVSAAVRAEADALFRRVFCSGDNVAMWENLIPAILDNYNVRSFIGERAFHTPFGGITQQHAEVARRLLLQFDLVMDLDAGERAANLLMFEGLGWNVTLAQVHARSSDHVSTKFQYDRAQCANEPLLKAVLPRQGPDRELYSTGKVLGLLDELLLGWARQLGLRPRPDLGATAASSPAGSPLRCGLLDRILRGLPPADSKLGPEGEGPGGEAYESEEEDYEEEAQVEME